ncbi:cysteine dioxygenase family protein [Paraburkholderia acidisoli]|uniref:Cysteine dioxygenase n=1 Tax=Paraburkholderia acidisoli TaxID=2571748 RepID=A0A7Z2GKY1_9BURK|nr:cysteine dioxygenase [Paraburkholderia acidisoli]QGZ63349.1 cysteine dioxygenase [Paraburkholderia acidisoli]
MTSHEGGRLNAFVQAVTAELDRPGNDEAVLLAAVARHMGTLVSVDDWLDAPFAQPDPHRYRQYLLHADPRARFSVVSFVWGPGQATPVHDHTVWGVIGMLRGAEIGQHYAPGRDRRLTARGAAHRLEPGEVTCVSPSVGDIHAVRNAFGDRVSISIHAYGGDIGRIARHVYAPDGTTKPFVSGYSPLQ